MHIATKVIRNYFRSLRPVLNFWTTGYESCGNASHLWESNQGKGAAFFRDTGKKVMTYYVVRCWLDDWDEPNTKHVQIWKPAEGWVRYDSLKNPSLHAVKWDRLFLPGEAYGVLKIWA